MIKDIAGDGGVGSAGAGGSMIKDIAGDAGVGSTGSTGAGGGMMEDTAGDSGVDLLVLTVVRLKTQLVMA